ncbi:hypothetical protein DEO72_LG9g1938 [Vigna unguiculata]|uniref:Uncharacterized protein n=1 Tax=Vigna unguiculata TaxID=3917 RepID=A0A4D6N228_VIGUN|nr:hypothetical protein DEO72_LG9g1938 [Vigna unguiculata]
MDDSGCGITSTGGVWLCCGMVVGCRFRVCVARGREIERCSGTGESFSKKKNGSAGVRRSGSGRGRGRGLGFLAGRGFGVSGPLGGKTWRRGVCGAALCVCWKKKERRGV